MNKIHSKQKTCTNSLQLDGLQTHDKNPCHILHFVQCLFTKFSKGYKNNIISPWCNESLLHFVCIFISIMK